MRNEKGQFLAGNSGGPGRPKRQTEASYLEVLLAACPPEKWQEIVERAVDDATGGDDKARAWLASYLIGRPAGVAPSPTSLAIALTLGGDTPEFLRALSAARQDLAFHRLIDGA